jgi:hypothetical protein
MAQVWVNANKSIRSALTASKERPLIVDTSFCHDGEAFHLAIYQERVGASWILRAVPPKGKPKAVGAGTASVKGDKLNMSQSALIPKYRGRGIYQAVIRAFLGVFQQVCSDTTGTMTEASTKSWQKLGGKLQTTVTPTSPGVIEMFKSLGRPAPKETSSSRYCLPGKNKRGAPMRSVTADEICGPALRRS